MFKAVGAHEIPDVWEFVEKGLQQIIRRCDVKDWTARDVYRLLRQNRSYLYVRDEGFVVLERCLASISGEPYLNVWLMWFKPGEAIKMQPALVAWLDQVRDQQRCEWIEFSSPRDEWGPVIAADFKRASTIWRRYK